MSQAKVDQHKAEKRNRKQENAKKKRMRALKWIIAIVIIAAIVIWAIYSGVHMYQENQPTTTTEINMSPLTDFISSLSSN